MKLHNMTYVPRAYFTCAMLSSVGRMSTMLLMEVGFCAVISIDKFWVFHVWKRRNVYFCSWPSWLALVLQVGKFLSCVQWREQKQLHGCLALAVMVGDALQLNLQMGAFLALILFLWHHLVDEVVNIRLGCTNFAASIDANIGWHAGI